MKTALTAADMLNDQVLPFYEEHGIELQRVLTDRGSEYCGKADEHEYQLYQVAFRKKVYNTIEQLQEDLDIWLKYYNEERTHQGKQCCGRTPLQTLLDAKNIVEQKTLHRQFENPYENQNMPVAI